MFRKRIGKIPNLSHLGPICHVWSITGVDPNCQRHTVSGCVTSLSYASQSVIRPSILLHHAVLLVRLFSSTIGDSLCLIHQPLYNVLLW